MATGTPPSAWTDIDAETLLTVMDVLEERANRGSTAT